MLTLGLLFLHLPGKTAKNYERIELGQPVSLPSTTTFVCRKVLKTFVVEWLVSQFSSFVKTKGLLSFFHKPAVGPFSNVEESHQHLSESQRFILIHLKFFEAFRRQFHIFISVQQVSSLIFVAPRVSDR